MKNFRKYLTILLTLCLTILAFNLSACKQDDESFSYYAYQSVEMDMDIEIPSQSDYVEVARQVENAGKNELLSVKTSVDQIYQDSIVAFSNKRLVWFNGTQKNQFTFVNNSSSKKYVAELDAEVFGAMQQTLADLKATLTEVKISVEKSGDVLELEVEVTAQQNIIDNVTMLAEYEVEYKFAKTSLRPENDGVENPTATYSYKGFNLLVEVDVVDEVDGEEQVELQLSSDIKSVLDSALASFKNSINTAKVTIYQDVVAWHNSGLKTTYSIAEKDQDQIELADLSTGVIKTLKEYTELYGSQRKVTINGVSATLENGANGYQLKVEIDASTTAVVGQTTLNLEVEYEYTILLKK